MFIRNKISERIEKHFEGLVREKKIWANNCMGHS